MTAGICLRWLAVPLTMALGADGLSMTVAAAEPKSPDARLETNVRDSVDKVQELEWEALVPEGWRPDEVLQQYDVEQLDDSDPRAAELMSKLQALWDEAPVVKALDGKKVKLPGFVVPIEGDGEAVSEFLLVPYYGACIHVPPPPANQTVYVVTGNEGAAVRKLFDTVWVTGILSAKSNRSDLANAGYTLRASKVEPYDE